MGVIAIKRPSVTKYFRNTIDINVPIIGTSEYDFDDLDTPSPSSTGSTIMDANEYAETVRALQERPGMQKLIEDSMNRNKIEKQVLDVMIQEGIKQAEEQQLATQALYDYIMGMIFEYLVMPAGIPRDDWSINQNYFQNLTNMIMSGVQTGGQTEGMAFRNNFVSNLSYYQTNQAYYNDYAAPMVNIVTQQSLAQSVTEGSISQVNTTNTSVNNRVANIRNLIRNTYGN